MKDALDSSYSHVAARANQNAALQFETVGGKSKIVISKLDRLDESDSLISLRRDVHQLMPKGGIPDIFLEVMNRTGFATHLSERPAQVVKGVRNDRRLA